MICSGFPCIECSKDDCRDRAHPSRDEWARQQREEAEVRLLDRLIQARISLHRGTCNLEYIPHNDSLDISGIRNMVTLTNACVVFLLRVPHSLDPLTNVSYTVTVRTTHDDYVGIDIRGEMHPHVKDGAPCFGENVELVNSLMADKRYTELYYLIRNDLRGFNPASPWHRPICEKSFVPTQRCLSCDLQSCAHALGIVARCHTLRRINDCWACPTPCQRHLTYAISQKHQKEEELRKVTLLLRRESHWAALLNTPPMDKTPVYEYMHQCYAACQTIEGLMGGQGEE